MAYKILIPQDIAEEGKAFLRERGYEIKHGNGFTEQDLIRDVEDCDAVLLRTAEFPRSVMEAGRKLKIIARHGAGYNNVDIQAADELGILVTNTPDATTETVAEYALGGILMAAKRMAEHRDKLKQGDFLYKNSHKGTDLKGKTLGIVGIGRIGMAVAKKAHFGFDMDVTAYSPRKKQDQLPEYIRLVSWEDLFEKSDFITVHVPLNDETKSFIGREEFNRMKSSAYLINCSRGGVAAEAELIEALENNQIAGLFTDVMDQEPPDMKHPFFQMDQVTVTPHMASNTEECMALMALQAAMQIDLALSGKDPDWVVNHRKSEGRQKTGA